MNSMRSNDISDQIPFVEKYVDEPVAAVTQPRSLRSFIADDAPQTPMSMASGSPANLLFNGLVHSSRNTRHAHQRGIARVLTRPLDDGTREPGSWRLVACGTYSSTPSASTTSHRQVRYAFNKIDNPMLTLQVKCLPIKSHLISAFLIQPCRCIR